MGKAAWNVIRQGKFFYVGLYRKILFLLGISLVLNLLLCVGVYYFYFHQPLPEFYASNGVTQPIKLTPRFSPNYSSEALLPPEPRPDESAKVTLQ